VEDIGWRSKDFVVLGWISLEDGCVSESGRKHGRIEMHIRTGAEDNINMAGKGLAIIWMEMGH
jgi:hypothetical protein